MARSIFFSFSLIRRPKNKNKLIIINSILFTKKYLSWDEPAEVKLLSRAEALWSHRDATALQQTTRQDL